MQHAVMCHQSAINLDILNTSYSRLYDIVSYRSTYFSTMWEYLEYHKVRTILLLRQSLRVPKYSQAVSSSFLYRPSPHQSVY